MDIRSITWFKIDQPIAQNTAEIEELLSNKVCKPCPSNEPESFGWVSPFGETSEVLAHSSSHYLLLTAQKETRLLPASVIKDVVNEKVSVIEQTEGRIVTRKEKSRIKEEAMFTLLPKAFIKKTQTKLYIDTKNQLLAVCCSSKAQTDQVTQLLRTTLGSLKITPLTTKLDLSSLMSKWLLETNPPENLQIGNDCQMNDITKEQGSVKFDKHDLTDASVLRHLKEGKSVSQLALIWQEAVSFTLTKDLTITKIKWLELETLESGPLDNSDPAQMLDANFILMSGILANIINTITTAATPNTTTEASYT